MAYAKKRLKTIDYLRTQSPWFWTEVALPSLIYGSMGPLVGMAEGLGRRSVTVVDDISILWSLIERTDVAEAYYLLLERECRGREYVLAEPQALPIVTVYSMVASQLGVSFTPLSMQRASMEVTTDDYEVMVMSQPVDAALFSRQIGWRPKHSFATSIADLMSHIHVT